MPLISRIMIRLSLLYFVVGSLFGALLLLDKAFGFYPPVWQFLPVHIELMLFGWILQFTLGTGYWMLPRLIIGKPRGNENTAILIPVLLNMGIMLLVLSYLLPQLAAARAVGRFFEFLAIPVFILLHWKRISKQPHTD